MRWLPMLAVACASLCPASGWAQAASFGELAFVSLRGGEAQIYRRQPDGAILPVTQGPGYSMHPAWSSRGDWAFAQFQGKGTRVLVCEAECQAPRRVSSEPDWQEHSPSWSPDGRSLVYVARPLRGGDTELRLLDIQSGRHEVLLKSPSGVGPDPVSWSRDGMRLVVIAAGSDRKAHAWLIDRADGRSVNLTEPLSPEGALYAQVSPDGRQLAWARQSKGRNPVLLTDVETLETRDLMPGQAVRVESPRWSPDGLHLAVSLRSLRAPDSNGNVVVLRLSDGAQRALTDHPAEDFDPRWSADGSTIYFASLRTGTSLLYEVNSKGGPTRSVSEHKSHDMGAVPRAADLPAPTAPGTDRVARGRIPDFEPVH